VVALRNFCFISPTNTDSTTFDMHALVQLATRNWLEAIGKLEQWKQQFISNLCIEFPTGEYESQAACQAVITRRPSSNIRSKITYHLLFGW